jgi:hypothetical protein
MKILLGALACLTVVSAFASDEDPGDIAAVKACLRNFGKHPFNAKEPHFRTMSAKVRVFGIGGSAQDEMPTTKPELILVKPNVSVLSKSELNLLNPNGWYCLKGQVSVLGKSEIHLACKAKLAASRDGVNVLGGTDHDSGVTVLGSSKITKVGCPVEDGSEASADKATAPAMSKSEGSASAVKPETQADKTSTD